MLLLTSVVLVPFSLGSSSVRREEDGRKGGSLGDGEVRKEGAEESGKVMLVEDQLG